MAAGPGLIVGIVVATSLVVLVAIARGGRAPWRPLARAVVVALETLGATVLLFGANLAAGAIVVLAARRLTPYYLSLYSMSDVSVLVLSLLQALVLQAWRQAVRR